MTTPTAHLDLDPLGARLRILVEDHELGSTVAQLTRHLRADGNDRAAPAEIHVSGKEPWTVRWNAQEDIVPSRGDALATTLAAINLLGVRGTSTLSIHAAVVARGETTLALPAPSGAGKTTLAAALLKTGWEYLSDEALCVDWGTRHVRAYPRALALSPWALGRVGGPSWAPEGRREHYVMPEDLGAPVRPWVERISHFVLIDPHVKDNLHRVPRRDVVAALLERAFTAHLRPAFALKTISDLVTTAETWKVGRLDPMACARAIDAVAG